MPPRKTSPTPSLRNVSLNWVSRLDTREIVLNQVEDDILYRFSGRQEKMVSSVANGTAGTGKTYTIHYPCVHSSRRSHATVLITAEQAGLLDQYFHCPVFSSAPLPWSRLEDHADPIGCAARASISPCRISPPEHVTARDGWTVE